MTEEEKVHLHIETRHKPGTPDYPSDQAVYIYKMACGLKSEEYERTHRYGLHNSLDDIKAHVTCPKCLKLAKSWKQNREADNVAAQADPSSNHDHSFIFIVEWTIDPITNRYAATRLRCECGAELDREVSPQ